MMNMTEVPAFPHIRSKKTTAALLWDVVIALAPAAVFRVCRLGLPALFILALAVATCAILDYGCNKLRRRSGSYEPGGVVMGLILGMSLQPDVPYWLPVAGGAFAILFVKMLFGGLGNYLFHPAATAMVVMIGGLWNYLPELTVQTGDDIGLLAGFLGGGDVTIDVIGPLLLLLGGLYLVLRRVICLRIPFFYLLTFGAVTIVLRVVTKNEAPAINEVAALLCNEGLLLGAFFMATDTTTSPMTRKGKVVYGILLGILTAAFSEVTRSGHEVLYGIVAGNLFVRLIDVLTYPRYFGKGKKAK